MPIMALLLTSAALMVGTEIACTNTVHAPSNIYYVAKNGSDSNPGTQAQPWLTIEKAATTAVAGDTVYIRGGTYNEYIQISSKLGSASSWLRFVNYPGETVIIDGTGLTTPIVRLFNDTYLELNGLQIQNSANSCAIFASGETDHLNFINLVIHDTYANAFEIANYGYGFAGNIANILIDGCNVYNVCTGGVQEGISLSTVNGFEIRNCIVHDCLQAGIDTKVGCSNGSIHNNKVYNVGQGLYIDEFGYATSNIDVYDNVFHNNGAGISLGCENGGGADMRNINIYNNILYGNTRGFNVWPGDPAPYDKTFSFVNNTLYHNADTGLTEIAFFDAAGYYQNCVVANNIIVLMAPYAQAISDPHLAVASGAITVDHNLVYDATGTYQGVSSIFGTNAIKANPLLVNPPTDCGLQAGSPAIDAGSSTLAPAFDFAGTPRPQGAGYDIGAYEYKTAPGSSPSVTTSSLPNGTVGVAYSQTLAATGGTTPYTWTIASGTLPAGLTLSSGGVISGTPTTAGGPTSVTFQVTDSTSATATKSLSITINNTPTNGHRVGAARRCIRPPRNG